MRLLFVTSAAMVAFAANSLLCRVALRGGHADAASFTAVRICSGAIVLWLLAQTRASSRKPGGNWTSALALFTYAAAFSFAYLTISAGTGALLLFGAVQATMIATSLLRGERLHVVQATGLVLALSGVVVLVLPGITAPPLAGAVLMLLAGVAWGVYSLRGKQSADPLAATAGNFIRAVPLALALALAAGRLRCDASGLIYAAVSGSVASGVGYAIWYSALRTLRATTAASVQLSVPLIAALGGILLLDEPLTLRFALASIAVLGGIGLVVAK